MGIGSRSRALLALLSLAALLASGCTRKSAVPGVFIAEDASWHERAAASEIRRYLFLRTGELPEIREVRSFAHVPARAVAVLEKGGSLEEYKAILGQLPKLRMNFFGLHTYPENPSKEKGATPNAEPTVWIGRGADFGPDGCVVAGYPTSYQNTARGAYTATLPPPAGAIEYYIEVKAGGETALFPATAPGLNQTVIVLPVMK